MRKANRLLVGIPCVIFTCLCNRAFGIIVNKSAFNASAAVEGFEAIPTSVTTNFGTDYELATPYVFPSGLILSAPLPNRSDSFGVFVVHGGFFGLFSGQDVPDGIGYLGQSNPDDLTGPIQLTFPNPVHLVGAYIADGSSVTMSVLGVGGNVLETDTISDVQPSAWSSNFFGIQRPELIGSVVFTGDRGDVLRIDDLTFEVPEPSSTGILVATSILACCRRKKARL